MNTTQPSGAIGQLLASLEITSIIWIDDKFSQTTEQALRLELNKLIKVGLDNQIALSHPRLSGLDADSPDEIRTVEIDRILGADGIDISEINSQIISDIIKSGNTALLTILEELTASQFIELQKLLANVQTLSFRKWAEIKSTVIAEPTNSMLFLVDREAKLENLSDTMGDEIIRELVSNPNFSGHCVMLTHTVAPEATEGLRQKIVSQTQIPPHGFSVMSKRVLGHETARIDAEFSRAACAVFTNKLCYDLTTATCAAMSGSLATAANDLTRLSIDDVDKAIFENSLEEGASEFDVIERILVLKQRNAVREHVSTNGELINKIGKLRAIKSLGVGVGPLHSDAASKAQLFQWRRAEVLTGGDLINRAHSPLSCGDVFQKIGTTRYFVLLRQPCDLMVRGAGDGPIRKAKEAIWAQLKVDQPTLEVNEGGVPMRSDRAATFRLEGAGLNGKDWLVDFYNVGWVDLRVLDFAAFSPTGDVCLSLDSKASNLFLPGLKRLFDESIRDLQKLQGNWPDDNRLSLSDIVKESKGKWDPSAKKVSFPYRRIGRINQPWAQVMFGSFAAFHTRTALDGNFARKLVQQEPGSSGE